MAQIANVAFVLCAGHTDVIIRQYAGTDGCPPIRKIGRKR